MRQWITVKKRAVFLDTTVFEAELFDFESRHIKALCSLVREGYLQILLTDVTKREIESHIVEAVQSAVRGLAVFRKDRQHGVLRHFGEMFRPLYLKHDAEALSNQLKDRFEAFCRECGATVLPTGDLKVGPILDKYFSGKPPFGDGRKKHEFPDAISAAALVAWKVDSRELLWVVSADDDWRRVCEDRHQWDKSLPEFLAYFPDPEIVSKIKGTLLTSGEFNDELAAYFMDVSFYVPKANGNVTRVSGVKTKVIKVLVTDVEDVEAVADVRFWVEYCAHLTFEIPGTGLWDEEGERIYAADTTKTEITESFEMSAQVELGYDKNDATKIKVNRVQFEPREIEIDIDDLLKYYKGDSA